MSYEPGNANFTQLFNNFISPNIFQGLVNSGILPQGFRVAVATVNLAGSAALDTVQVLDLEGNNFIFQAGEEILYITSVPTTAVTGGGQLQLRLSTTASGTAGTALTAVGSVDSGALLTSGPVIVSTATFLIVEITTDVVTTGALQIVVIVV